MTYQNLCLVANTPQYKFPLMPMKDLLHDAYYWHLWRIRTPVKIDAYNPFLNVANKSLQGFCVSWKEERYCMQIYF